MELIERAFREMYPDRDYNYIVNVHYSGKFTPYNANIKMRGDHLQLNLSKTWRGVDSEIILGLVQDLLSKLFGSKTQTLNIQLYDSFIKNIHLSIPKENIDPALKRSFDRVNNGFFSNQLESPNLTWGSMSKRKLACYNFHTDTICVSRIFENADCEILDYVMYHEMLHKFMKFKSTKSRHTYHSFDFRKAEKSYPNSYELEKRIRNMAFTTKKRSILGWLLK